MNEDIFRIVRFQDYEDTIWYRWYYLADEDHWIASEDFTEKSQCLLNFCTTVAQLKID